MRPHSTGLSCDEDVRVRNDGKRSWRGLRPLELRYFVILHGKRGCRPEVSG